MSLLRSLTALAAVGVLAACATTTGGASSSSSPSRTPDGICSADGLQSFNGQRHDASLENRVRQRANAASVRVLHPRSVMTLEYDPQRLNLRLNEDGVVQSAYCG